MNVCDCINVFVSHNDQQLQLPLLVVKEEANTTGMELAAQVEIGLEPI